MEPQNVAQGVQRAAFTSLSHAGGYIRRGAANSMRSVTDAPEPIDAQGRLHKPSLAGRPPVSVTQHPALRYLLRYAVDKQTQSVVVGPIRYRAGQAPGTLERGGTATIRNRRRMKRRIGDGGEMRIGLSGGKTTKIARNTLLGTVPVTYGPIRTADQAAHADRLNEQLYGPAVRVVHVPPHPFMGPALAASAAKIPSMWSASVRSD